MHEDNRTLLQSLRALPGHEDLYLSKRAETRSALRQRTTLDLQRGNGELFTVTVLDVSKSGIGFLCRKELKPNEPIGLRFAFQHQSAFEPFLVRRGTATVGGYKIGAVIKRV